MLAPVDRRQALQILGGGVLALSTGSLPAFSQTRVTVDEANLRPRPIAVAPFLGKDRRLGLALADIVTGDLERSGLFRPVDRNAYLQEIRNINIAPRFADWRSIGAEALVVGKATQLRGGRFRVQFRLWDVVLGKALAGKQFTIEPRYWRRLGHLVSDQIYQKLTLESGYFDTRIVFIDETGPKRNRLKRLAIMDQDGHNVQLLSNGRELVITPRFNPKRQEITYMSYQNGQPRVMMMDLSSGKRQIVGDFPGMTFAPRFSPDGQRIVMSFQQGGSSAIVEMDLRSRRSRRLTSSNAIDTGPCFSPDGRQIVFESDQDGTQQLYTMNEDGTSQKRISHGSGRYSTPVWSPRGDYIAFTKQYAGRFLIGVMQTDGSGERILTEGYHNEGPTWAPNGRVLMFFRESRGARGGSQIYSIDLTGYNERRVQTPSFASDPAWSPLRS
ncbi:MAG: Tol-Pal system beta propeller repeat protein TolB [Hyphomicrobiaceae bacterium]